MLALQVLFGILTLAKQSGRMLWDKATGKPYDSGMDM
jgi:hypothetical protein